MFLLVTHADIAENLIAYLNIAFQERTQKASSLRRAVALLRAGHFRVVVIDSTLLDADPAMEEIFYGSLGATVPVVLNLAVVSRDRLLLELRVAVEREESVRNASLRAAETILQSRIRGTVAGLLLACDQALERADSGYVRDRLASIRAAAVQLCTSDPELILLNNQQDAPSQAVPAHQA